MRQTDCLYDTFSDLRAHGQDVQLWDFDARENYFDAVAQVLLAMSNRESAWACAVLVANDLAVRYGMPLETAMIPVWSRVTAGWEKERL